MKCRNCNNQIKKSFLNLGKQPLANSLLKIGKKKYIDPKYPLEVFFCQNCYLVQIDKVVNQKKIFNQTYPYFSSYSDSWLRHAKDYSLSMIKKLKLKRNSFVIEIASNDGYLLQNFNKRNIPCLGIEPTKNTAAVASSKGINTINKFFSSKLATKIKKNFRQPNLIICKNVLAHVPNLNDFAKGLDILSGNRTITTIEFPHLLNLVQELQYDTIYHEHFSYFSVLALQSVFKKTNLHIFDVKEVNTHGGSLRIYLCKKESSIKIKKNVSNIIKKELLGKLDRISTFNNFAKKVQNNKTNIIKFLKNCKKNSKTVIGYGAAAKGNTLLNYCGINSNLMSHIFDVSPYKQQMLMPGSKIPILHPNEIGNIKPNYIVLLPWNLKTELIRKLSKHKKNGSKFLIMIPKLEII